jgi:CHAT domain-containing protein
VERGRAREAWTLLHELDGLGVREAAARCAGEPDGRPLELRQELVAQLIALELPAAGDRRAQRRATRRTLMERLQELERSHPRCAAQAVPLADAAPDYRAVPLEDEVLLLRRDASGQVTLYRRTALPRARLVRSIREVERMIAEREPDDRRWTETVAPLVAALVPAREDLGERTSFAMYGALQRVPLAALPLSESGGGMWLADATVVVHRPAGAVTTPPVGSRPPAGAPLFVVDPSRDLSGGSELARFYERVFPGSQVLAGSEATRGALRERLPAARWLHVDAHVRYDPAFPELSSLQLADAPVGAIDLRPMSPSLEFANLSACRSGEWPVTADSGRFGLAGLLARHGVRWVIGTRADLADTLARDFNRAFYAELARGVTVPAAYHAALGQVLRIHPASSWAALVLLEAVPIETGGQSAAARTPQAGGAWPATMPPDEGMR